MEYLIVYSIGGLLYALLEIVWRGWTHWSMALCGGACFTLMYLISMSAMPLYRKLMLCAAAITTVEFFTGYIVNLRLGWQVWDYSSLRFNLLGQICPGFTLLWLLLSVPGLRLCSWLRQMLSRFS